MRAVRPASVVLSCAAIAALAFAGCGDGAGETPIACLDGTGVYLGALGSAPAEVRLNQEVPISDCLAVNQPGGELATIGATMVSVATRLNREARAEPGGDAAVRLGYLLGAAERGAEETGGIHADLLRRLEAAADYSPDGSSPASAPFQAAYERGREAGLADG
jgi:hypothetical protein